MAGSSLAHLRAAVDALLVGQADAKTGCLLGLLARRHVLLEGPPGCGKSALAEGVAAVSGARHALISFHRETSAADLLGPQILLRRTLAGRERLSLFRADAPLHQAEILVLDDLSRAPGEALVPLLRILVAQSVQRRAAVLECAIATAVPARAASASDPLEPAQLDRFTVQLRLHGLLSGDRWSEGRRVLDGSFSSATLPVIDTEERHALQRRAADIPLPVAVRAALVALAARLGGLRAPDGGLCVSDRSFALGAPALLRAHALLRGAGSVQPPDLAAVRFMLGRRVPESLLALAEEMVEDAARGAAPGATSVATRARSAGPGAGEGEQHPNAPSEESGEIRIASAARPAAPPSPADVAALLRALEGRLEPGRVERAGDPGGSPRRQARLSRLDEIEAADPVEALLFVDGELPGAPRVLRRERRSAAGALAVLRDVSASMEGALGRATSQVVAGLVRLGARRRMRIGYLEFHHEAEPFEVGGAFFHRRYGRLLALAARERAEGRTSYEAPLRAALGAFGPAKGGERHVVLLTDGIPVVGDPGVARERALARRLGVRIHTVFMGSGEPPSVLERIARETHGQAFVLETSARGTLRVRERGAA
jgi:MoxR-like ATPase